MNATDTQQDELKALARAVLERNKGRNTRATQPVRPRNFCPKNSTGKLREGCALSLDEMQDEYFSLLARFWEIDEDPAASLDEARRLVVRLDELYRELHSQGRRVAIRLPVERNRNHHEQKEIAL